MINVWDVRTGTLLGACVGHKQGITALSFAPDGQTLASASHDGTLKFWNIASLQQLTSFSIPGDAHNPIFSPDGTLLVFGQSLKPKGIRFYSAPLPLETDLASQNLVKP